VPGLWDEQYAEILEERAWTFLHRVKFQLPTELATKQLTLVLGPVQNEDSTYLNGQLIGSLGGDVKTVFSGKYGADYVWSPDGKKAAVSFLAQQGKSQMNLGIVTLDGAYQDLGIPTLASKVVWSKDGKTLYYALAGSIPDGAVMPDDYDSKKFTSSDTFWKVDTTTGQKSRIVETSDIMQNYDASQLFLSPTEDALFFVNRIDGKLYRINL